MKTHCKCGVSLDSTRISKKSYRCHACERSYHNEYRRKNKNKVKEWAKDRHYRHRDRLLENAKIYYKENKEAQNLKNNRNYQKNKEKISAKQREYYHNNKEQKAIVVKEYVRKNRKKVTAQQNAWNRRKRATCPMFATMSRVRSRHNGVLKKLGIRKIKKTLDYIGCTPEELIAHIQSQFLEDMTWENRKLWHIDHIVPISSAKTEDEIYKLCHYTNLRPLWASDNIRKSNKIINKEEENEQS